MKKNTPKSEKKYSHLTLDEREEIAVGLENGMIQSEIALKIGRPPCTISREIKRNSPCLRTVRYRANRAQMRADERKERKNKRERIPDKRLRGFICKYLKAGYSPEIIAFKAGETSATWKTNYETIYQWIYKDRQDLIPFLPKSHKNVGKGARQSKNAVQKYLTGY